MDIYELIAWVKFNEGPIKVIGNFVLVVTAAIVAHLLVPWVKKWIKKYQKKQKVKRKAAKALVVQIESDQPKEVRRRALITLWAMVLKEWWFIPVTIGLMVVMFALVIELEREAQAAKLIIAESHIDTVDSARKLLWSRTVRNIEKPEPLREVHTKDEHLQFLQMAEVWLEEEKDIIVRERLCERRAYVEGENAIGADHVRIRVTLFSYQACMLEKQWVTEHCSLDDPGCKELLYFETDCTRRIRQWVEEPGDFEHIEDCFPFVQGT